MHVVIPPRPTRVISYDRSDPKRSARINPVAVPITTYNDPNSNSPHAIGTDGNEMWENGEWSITYQVKGSDPVQIKGYGASIAVREDGVWKKRMVVSIVTPAPAK
jgi:hypothetical protein